MVESAKFKMQESSPSAKVLAATLAAFLAPLLVRLLARLFTGDDALPGDFETVVRQLVEAAAISGLTFAAGYAQAPAPRDAVVPVPPPPDAP